MVLRFCRHSLGHILKLLVTMIMSRVNYFIPWVHMGKRKGGFGGEKMKVNGPGRTRKKFLAVGKACVAIF